jgi:branched-chain amino acid transport system permease protein
MNTSSDSPVSAAPVPADSEPAGDDRSGLTLLARYQRPLLQLGALLVLAFAASIMSQGGFAGQLVTQMAVFAIAAMGVDFLGGFGGLVSLGQASFLGLGAYGVAVSMVHGAGPWTAIGISLVVTLAVALVVGLLAVRVSGIAFVIMTLSVGQILFGLSSSWVAVSGGDNGLILPSKPVLGPLDLNDPRQMSFAVLDVFIIAALVLYTFVHSPFGLSLRGIKSNEQRLKTLGYTTRTHRYIGYVISTFFGGIAGILFVLTNGLITPTALDFGHNGIITLMAVVGGLGTLWGPVLGSVIIVMFQQYLSLYFERWTTVMGVLLVAVVIFAPEGLWGIGRKYARRLSHQSGGKPATVVTTALPKGDSDSVADETALPDFLDGKANG